MGKTARGSPPRGGAWCGERPAILPWPRFFRWLYGGRAAVDARTQTELRAEWS